jgi:hypothetical protein
VHRVNILTADNGVGLTRTSRILAEVLTGAGHEVTVHGFEEEPAAGQTYTCNLFLERVLPGWTDTGEVNLLVPNQEWFREEHFPLLAEIDAVVCKTRYAQQLFDELGCVTHFTSFTSLDRAVPGAAPDYARFFHLAGRSLQKGTETIVDRWHDHPEWPELTLVQHPETKLDVTAPNIAYISDYLDEERLRGEQNVHGVHLCPSETEGFGHYLVEAMSCSAVTITVDGPPMNQLVTPARGILAGYRHAETQGLGERYPVDPVALERAVQRALAMDTDDKRRLGRRARAWYEHNDAYFRRRIVEVLDGALQGRRPER